jgi:hypothetical protein
MNVVVSLAAAACVVVVMEHWLRAADMRHKPVLAAVLLCTTWLFARTAVLGPEVMLTTLFSTLALANFFFVYRNYFGVRKETNGPNFPFSIFNLPFMTSRATLPVWLFGAMLCGGVMGLVAPVTGIAAFILVKGEWRQTWRWFGLREVLIFSVLCFLWFYFRHDGSPIFTLAPREHLFWYVPRLLRDLLPWTPLYLIFLGLAVWRKKLRSDMARFLYTAIWANIVVMSLIASKSELYLLPIYPLVAYLTAALFGRRS